MTPIYSWVLDLDEAQDGAEERTKEYPNTLEEYRRRQRSDSLRMRKIFGFAGKRSHGPKVQV